MEPLIQYAQTSDGVSIAYCVEGEGPPLLVVPFFVESFSLLPSLVPEWAAAYRSLGENRKLICYDMRGTGFSQREVDDLSSAALVRDIDAVVTATGCTSLSLFAQTAGGMRAIEYAALHPDVVTDLVLLGTYSRMRDVMTPDVLRSFAQLAQANWPLAAQALTDLRGRRTSERLLETVRAVDLFTESTTGGIVAKLLLAHAEADVTDLLPKVRAKTTVLHWIGDNLVPFVAAQTISSRVPGARLVTMVPSSPAEAMRRVIDLLGEGIAPAVAARAAGGFRTVLFTDLVAHSEMMSRLGDARGREVLREHERLTREVLKAHGGTEVKTMGDGFMASFGSVTRAVECATALQRAIAEWNASLPAHREPVEGREEPGDPAHASRASARAVPVAPLQVRCGLNAGEPIEEEGDLFGATVILAARIAAKAEGGEILVANAVRELCAGKGFLFADRGEFVAKGFEEPVRLFEVRWWDADKA